MLLFKTLMHTKITAVCLRPLTQWFNTVCCRALARPTPAPLQPPSLRRAAAAVRQIDRQLRRTRSARTLLHPRRNDLHQCPSRVPASATHTTPSGGPISPHAALMSRSAEPHCLQARRDGTYDLAGGVGSARPCGSRRRARRVRTAPQPAPCRAASAVKYLGQAGGWRATCNSVAQQVAANCPRRGPAGSGRLGDVEAAPGHPLGHVAAAHPARGPSLAPFFFQAGATSP